jgi:SWI/SNF-related matrix-associated actin-dependent regulator 1 of chromatin subfamily A
LGKTAAALITAFTLDVPFVYICPPFLVLNVIDEIEKWQDTMIDRPYNIGVNNQVVTFQNVMIIADSVLDRLEILENIKMFARWNKNAILIVDEVHRFKNLKTRRTAMLFGFKNIKREFKGIVQWFMDRKIMVLSGTPMPNRPIELFPVLNKLAPDCIHFMDEYSFGCTYCDPKQTAFGWDFSGACDMKNLIKNMTEKFMLRIFKKDIDDKLPPKIEEMIFIGRNTPPVIERMEREILKIYSPKDLIKKELTAKFKTYEGEEMHISTYRKQLGIFKLPEIVTAVMDLMDCTDEAFILFAVHKEVIARLMEGLSGFKPLRIDGTTPKNKRQLIVKEFQNNSKRRLLVGNIQAAGLGLNMTKANRILMAEWTWNDKTNEQATDRAHRIGQHKTVLVQYLVYKNSLDRKMLDVIFNKRKIGEGL